MSAFIKLSKQDAFVVPYTAHKTYVLPSTALSGSGGWQFYYGTKDTGSLFRPTENTSNGEYQRLVFDSVKHLYYSNFETPSIESGSFENYNQTTLFHSRSLSAIQGDHIFVMSATRRRAGEGIYPNTFRFASASFGIIDNGEGVLLASSSITLPQIVSSSVEIVQVTERLTIQTVDNGTPFIQFTTNTAYGQDGNYELVGITYLSDLGSSPLYELTSQTTSITSTNVPFVTFTAADTIGTADISKVDFADNGSTGNLIEFTYNTSASINTVLAPATTLTANQYIGNIFYPHGIAVVTNSGLASQLNTKLQYSSSVSWRNSHTVFQYEYRCRVRESELNFSQNPSIKTGNNGDMYGFATASFFQPYITTVGLYNDSNELIAVGKLAQPVPKSKYMDMNFVVKLDI